MSCFESGNEGNYFYYSVESAVQLQSELIGLLLLTLSQTAFADGQVHRHYTSAEEAIWDQ